MADRNRMLRRYSDSMPHEDSASALDLYMRQLRRLRPIPRDEEEALLREYRRTGCPKLGRRLVESHLPLVVKLACEYARDPERQMELVQEGNIGLIRALDRYDPDGGARFPSYGSFWIRAYQLRYIMASARLVKVGTSEQQRVLFWSLSRLRADAEAEGVDDGDALVRLIAERLEMPEAEVSSMLQRLGAGGELSLEAPINPHGVSDRSRPRTIGDVMESGALPPDGAAEARELRVALRAALDSFEAGLQNPRERGIFRGRWCGDEPESLVAIGRRYGISRERARQLEVRLRRRLRAHLALALGDAVPAVPEEDLRRARRQARPEAPRRAAA